MNVKMIRIEGIEQNENSRTVYKRLDLSELMESMKQHGLLQPVGLKQLDNDRYDLIYGNRRFVAAKKLGWAEIPAVILEDLDTKDSYVLNLVENIKRVNTTVAEDGRMFCMLEDLGLSVKEIAARVGVTQDRVRLAMDVHRDIPEEYREITVNKVAGKRAPGTISASTAKAINSIRKEFCLNRAQTRPLYEHAKKETGSWHKIRQVAPLMKAGFTIERALATVDRYEAIQITVYVKKNEREKIERNGDSVTKLAGEFLAKNFRFANLYLYDSLE